MAQADSGTQTGLLCQFEQRIDGKSAAAAVTAAFERLWLASGNGWISHYQLAPAAANPLRPDVRESGTPISGFAYAKGIHCKLASKRPPPSPPPASDNAEIRAGNAGTEGFSVLLIARQLRFNESGAGWTNAIDDTPFAAIHLSRKNGAWIAMPTPHDALSVPPDAVWRKPATAELPPHERWPKRGCKAPRLWTGIVCR